MSENEDLSELEEENLEEEKKRKKRKKWIILSVVLGIIIIATVVILALIAMAKKSNIVKKPVVYLYPEQTTEVSVRLDLKGKLTTTYPKYENGWKVTASPDGTLRDAKGMTYNYLYWEVESRTDYDLSKGFCVKGSETAQFLEKALAELGLNRREANEFIVYWLPLMEQNEYNVIAFQTDAYTESAKLIVDPAPDTLIRVFMAWYGSDNYVEIPKQKLTAPIRSGFTVVEWGGSKIR